MKTKTSILTLTKAFFILLVSCCLFSCNIEPPQKQEIAKRNYTVRLSNWVGSDYYECDSVIWITDSHFKLKNKEKQRTVYGYYCTKRSNCSYLNKVARRLDPIKLPPNFATKWALLRVIGCLLLIELLTT